MLVVLLALLGASLGFAELLVYAHQAAAAKYQVLFTAPKGLTNPVPAYEGLEGAQLSGEGLLGGHILRFVAFSYASNIGRDMTSMRREAEYRFADVAGTEGPVNERQGMLGGQRAVDLEGEPAAGRVKMFVLLRLTVVPGRVVAICYSGPGDLTDADRGFFEQFCAQGVTIRQALPDSKQE